MNESRSKIEVLGVAPQNQWHPRHWKNTPEILKCMMYHFLRGTKKPQDLDRYHLPILASFLWEGLLRGLSLSESLKGEVVPSRG